MAEASRNSVFAEVDGRLLTPALHCGVLPGVLRRTLLDSARAVEAEMTLTDLQCADRWFVGNSLHGLRLAALA